MMESEAVRNEEEVSKPKSAEPVVEEIIPPSAPTFTEETVDHFKEELKRIDDEKQKKKEALKARVKAAQERARLAREKQALQRAQSKREEENILKELEGEVQSAKSAVPPMAPPQRVSPLPPPPPLMEEQNLQPAFLTKESNDNILPPPPSYGMFDQLNMKSPVTAKDLPPPPPILMQSDSAEYEELPSAPPIPLPPPMYETNTHTHPTETVTHHDMAPPSFIEHEQNEISEAVTSTEETERLVREQSEILAQLEREKAADDAAIAAAATADFLEESERPANTTTTAPTEHNVRSSSSTQNTSNRSTPATATSSSNTGNGNTIMIGPNTRVTLRGEEQTKAAIANNSAMIVQCLVCRNWMQVANTATLMFCPSCSTISRAEPQTQITSIEEARLLMAYKRRKEKKEEKERKLREYREMSWSQYVKSFFVAPTETASGSDSRSSDTYNSPSLEMNDYNQRSRTRTSTQQLEHVQTYGGREANEEQQTRERLIPVETYSTERRQPARVAEKRPLHSCITGLTKTLTQAAGYPGRRGQSDGEIDGIDSSALLSVTRVGRN